MKRRCHLKPGEVLLVGRLQLPCEQWRWTSGRYADRPVLGISVWCPRCHKFNHHGFSDGGSPGFRLDEVSHRVSHCGCDSYWIGLDPSLEAKPDHRAKLKDFANLVSTWKTARERRLAVAQGGNGFQGGEA
jgi:hypothetical protein